MSVTDDDWIEHNQDGVPAWLTLDDKVQIKSAIGVTTAFVGDIEPLLWIYQGYSRDIIAYRMIKD